MKYFTLVKTFSFLGRKMFGYTVPQNLFPRLPNKFSRLEKERSSIKFFTWANFPTFSGIPDGVF